jgi:hypothetical protein
LMSMIYSIYAMTSFKIKNQKDKEHFFIFRIKKNECSTGKIFLKNSDARHRNAYLARVKTGKIGGGEAIPRVGTVYKKRIAQCLDY